MIWDSEHEDAYERANRESMLAFTRCADCERMVCEDCMNNLEQNICVDCENRRNGEGG
jgi:hypothetical protein